MDHTIAAGKKNHHFLIASDWHIQHLHEPSFWCLIKLAKKLGKNNTSLVILGDFLDVPYLMKKDANFQKWAGRQDGLDQYFIPQLEEECMLGNAVLDKLQGLFKSMVFVEGNHDYRLQWFSESEYCPHAYKYHFSLSERLRLAHRGYTHLRYNDWLELGNNLSLTHGVYHGPSALKKHYDASGKSVIYGHVHSHEVKAFVCRGNTRKAISLPTMATLNPAYIKNAPNSWTNGFALVTLKPNNHFQFHCFEIWDDELILPTGEIIKGKPL